MQILKAMGIVDTGFNGRICNIFAYAFGHNLNGSLSRHLICGVGSPEDSVKRSRPFTVMEFCANKMASFFRHEMKRKINLTFIVNNDWRH